MPEQVMDLLMKDRFMAGHSDVGLTRRNVAANAPLRSCTLSRTMTSASTSRAGNSRPLHHAAARVGGVLTCPCSDHV